MDFLKIQGQRPLSGCVKIGGAKNSSLPLLAASLLSRNGLELTNLPEVADIRTFTNLLTMLGARIISEGCGHRLIDTSNVNNTRAVYDIVRKMRASILVLGALLARFGRCEVSLPGGCAIGARPVDLHLKAMEALGAKVQIKEGYIHASAPNGLKGGNIIFDKITMTGTENAIMACALAKGSSKIINASKEPEVVQLCNMLKNAGLKITGIGSSEISIEGSNKELLDIKSTRVIPDRIEAGTYLVAGAITNSNIKVVDVVQDDMQAISQKLIEIGFDISYTCKNDICTMELIPAKTLKAFKLTTSEFPGFPTDMQAQFMALATQCQGASKIKETLFENRFMHASELQRLGASIDLEGNIATINGAEQLIGTDVMATDLRASSALVLAALVAKEETRIHRIYHLDRGYENLELKLEQLGASITRLKE